MPLFNSAAKYFGGLAVDELIGAFIVGAILTTVFWFVRTQILGHKMKITKGKQWCVWVTMAVLMSMLALLTIDASQYFVTQSNHVTMQLDEIRKAATNHPPSQAIEPILSLDQSEINISDLNPMSHHVTFVLTIFNSGTPSIIRNWRLKITGPDGETLFPPAVNFIEPGGEFFTNTLATGEVVLRKLKDNFIAEAGAVPIEKGGKRSGFVTFQVDETTREYLMSSATKYDLSFWDINRKEYPLPTILMTPLKRK
jgi:hypothetical protein